MSDTARIIYAGTPDFAVAGLQALIDAGYDVVAVYTQPDRPAGRGRELRASPVKSCALAHDIAVYQPTSLRDSDAQQTLENLSADLMVVAAYGLILPAEVLNTPRLGCINIHASLLPRWRGAAPIQRAILAGDSVTGVTIMQMDEGLDTGDILAQSSCEISDVETGSSLHDRLMTLGAETLLGVLPSILAQTVERHEQDDARACYAAKLNKAEAQVDWSSTAIDIQRAIQAFNAWPVAYTSYLKNGKIQTLRLWQARRLETSDSQDCEHGTVVSESADGIDVASGDGMLRITELQPEGKRRMSAADFLNANSLLGQRLG